MTDEAASSRARGIKHSERQREHRAEIVIDERPAAYAVGVAIIAEAESAV